MQRIAVILGAGGFLFTGIAALTLQLENYNPEIDNEVFNFITSFSNIAVIILSVLVFIVGIGGILLLLISKMGGR